MCKEELFWIVFNSIFSAFGSIATFAAVVVALWQTKYAHKKKLMVDFTDNLQAFDVNITGDSIKYVGIKITNIGNRNVILQNWGIHCEDNTDYLLVHKLDRIEQMISVLLPYTLQPEQQITLTIRADQFCKLIEDSSHFPLNKKLLFFIYDTTGKEYKIKSNKVVSQYLSQFASD